MEEIVEKIKKISGRYSTSIVFDDWIKMMAISISNGTDIKEDELWKQRENEYINTIKKYNNEEQTILCEIFGRLVELFEKEIKDYLGEIYMKCEMGNSRAGQFFTPFHLSKLTAKISADIEKIENSNEKVVINEPSVGGGGMILALAKILKEKGINYQKKLLVEAQDLDFRSVHMSYVQFSIIGLSAIVKQGDTLSTDKITEDRIYYTPVFKGIM